jgi:hypothetical protein
MPGILNREEVFPPYVHPGFLWVPADVGSCSVEVLTIDINPRIARRVLCPAQNVRAVVDAVEVDPLAVVADPLVRRRPQTDHRGKRRPAGDVRHHFVVLHAGRDVIRPPHNRWDAPASFKRGSLFPAKRFGSGSGLL